MKVPFQTLLPSYHSFRKKHRVSQERRGFRKRRWASQGDDGLPGVAMDFPGVAGAPGGHLGKE